MTAIFFSLLLLALTEHSETKNSFAPIRSDGMGFVYLFIFYVARTPSAYRCVFHFHFFPFFLVHNFSGHKETKPIVSIIGNVCDVEAIDKAFVGVDVVFHCAAFINFQYPPNFGELERVNIDGKTLFFKSISCSSFAF